MCCNLRSTQPKLDEKGGRIKMYAKLENDKLEYAPRNYETEDVIIINFNKSIELMKQYGYKELINIKPSFNKEKEHVVFSNYIETDDTIIVEYEVKKNEIEEEEEVLKQPTISKRVENLESEVSSIQIQNKEMMLIFGEEINK